MLNRVKTWSQSLLVSEAPPVGSEMTVSPKGFDESLHFLRLSLNTNMSLELSQGFVELHAREIHLVHDATAKGTDRQTEGGREREREQKRKSSATGFGCGVSL